MPVRFTELEVAGSYVIDPEPFSDDRGSFARVFCVEEFAEHGLEPTIVQGNLSRNRHRGTLRGMHFQRAPHEETKLVRCVSGALFDVVVDLRPDSPTFRRWAGVELTADNGRAMYVPRGCAHGFQTLEDGTVALYHASAPYTPDAEGGIRFDDPTFGVDWPLPVELISDKDRSWPDFDTQVHEEPR
jgi:dTDP-4-dehydrorhamnose 3,5-epimerase